MMAATADQLRREDKMAQAFAALDELVAGYRDLNEGKPTDLRTLRVRIRSATDDALAALGKRKA